MRQEFPIRQTWLNRGLHDEEEGITLGIVNKIGFRAEHLTEKDALSLLSAPTFEEFMRRAFRIKAVVFMQSGDIERELKTFETVEGLATNGQVVSPMVAAGTVPSADNALAAASTSK